MHESERHRIILSAVQERPVVTVADLVALTGASEATIRRDIAALHVAEETAPRARRRRSPCTRRSSSASPGGPSASTKAINIAQKRAIARAAVELCEDGDPIIINGGTTTFQMVHPLSARRHAGLHQLLPIAEHLLQHSKNTVLLPGGTIYREQNIILSPFDNDVTRNFYARRMFMGAQGLSAARADGGRPAADPGRAEADRPGRRAGRAGRFSSKFARRSSLILCPLDAHRYRHHRRRHLRPRGADARSGRTSG